MGVLYVAKSGYRDIPHDSIESTASTIHKKAVDVVGQKPNDDFLKFIKKIKGDIHEKDHDYGSIRIQNDLQFIITVSNYASKEENNFTIAHELGHLFLHTVIKKEKVQSSSEYIEFLRYGSGGQEAQANSFALCFLMPRKDFLEKKEYYKNNVYDLAIHYKVSVHAVMMRLEQIKN